MRLIICYVSVTCRGPGSNRLESDKETRVKIGYFFPVKGEIGVTGEPRRSRDSSYEDGVSDGSDKGDTPGDGKGRVRE